MSDAFTQLVVEKERTQFVFYGYRMAETGEVAGHYFKQAYSLNEALEDLNANEGVLEDAHLVLDAFLEVHHDQEDAVIHVQVVGAEEVVAKVREQS
jgi:hypothetical protein